MFSLSNKNIVVTGASRGIGAGIATILASLGARVAVTYSSSREKTEKVLKELPGSGHELFELNISSSDSIQKCFLEIESKFESIDGLVNNAGIAKDQLLLRMKDEDLDSVLNTNLRGSILCTKQVIKSMMKNRSGSVVNITSVIGQSGNAGQSNYAASKAGLEAFSKSIALELGSRNVRVNCVAPGFIVTDMTDALTDEQKKQIAEKIPLKTLGSTQDVAFAVAFLLSDESKYITGQTISVNGGLYM